MNANCRPVWGHLAEMVKSESMGGKSSIVFPAATDAGKSLMLNSHQTLCPGKGSDGLDNRANLIKLHCFITEIQRINFIVVAGRLSR
ncbi:hypothetical protein [Acinetobacter sp. WZC-1]|uniref:hypothetical protein n=1 Tax=Acinetobacter sp. WZC-1 TaxID=3459034 RepID=UPI00403D7EBE